MAMLRSKNKVIQKSVKIANFFLKKSDCIQNGTISFLCLTREFDTSLA